MRARGEGSPLLLLLLLAGLHTFPAVQSTTVIPLCGSNETDSCTTALVQTGSSPRVAQVGITRCRSEMQNFCFNGHCMYLVELDQHYCRCDMGYSGVRCGLSNLDLLKQPLSKDYIVLAVLLSLFFLTAASVAIYYFYRWYQEKNGRFSSNRDYKEVARETEKDGKLLHV
ncbi:proepiregulin-like [Heteronotia binoei]|uniref:proepiregulin-like n=1 Tax=Heteronotia binoei TaxID=13085 RepID=UPI00292D961F|nr:proepiregulin-like [Heteronotia binoei]